ncbi:hypothetical protein [uncultured Desulfuromusa sp.]|uniref:hypothetical protein n=1 Tax=uncultured Desulfuromusa sp. TaxID=219183 RepID=UPI002AA61CBB|nr:hypothetical protein [uncultured Desulfuromusa sp.]
MYGHQAIEDLKAYQAKNASFDPRKLDFLIGEIRNSQHFHFSSAEDVVEILKVKPGSSLFLEEQGEYITPPYKKCWFDLEIVDSKRMSQVGFLFQQIHPKWIIALCMEKIKGFNKWTPWPYSYLIGLGTTTMEIQYESLKEITDLTKLKFNIGSNIIATTHYRSYVKESKQDDLSIAKEGASQLSLLNFCLMLINCLNITTEENPPPEKLNKKRKKNKKQEMFSYKTLRLVLPQKEKICDSIGSDSNFDNRLHLCRGHFKTYSENNPLFGKYSGRYYWHPQIRGNKEKGLVTKDYVASPQKNV